MTRFAHIYRESFRKAAQDSLLKPMAGAALGHFGGELLEPYPGDYHPSLTQTLAGWHQGNPAVEMTSGGTPRIFDQIQITPPGASRIDQAISKMITIPESFEDKMNSTLHGRVFNKWFGGWPGSAISSGIQNVRNKYPGLIRGIQRSIFNVRDLPGVVGPMMGEPL